jgi:hypothetical protein
VQKSVLGHSEVSKNLIMASKVGNFSGAIYKDEFKSSFATSKSQTKQEKHRGQQKSVGQLPFNPSDLVIDSGQQSLHAYAQEP